jgi:hypothetical protein
MAKGRIIISAITMDKRINDLSDDTSRLAFTWLITFADREGRTHGDPALVRSLLFPRRSDVTVKRMEQYIEEWASLGLIIWYEAAGDRWIYFPAFSRHQAGFDQRHEAPSTIPAPPVPGPVLEAELVRTVHVQCTAEENRSESNRNEQKLAPAGAGVPLHQHDKVKVKELKCPGEWMDALYELCQVDKALASPGMRKRLSECGLALFKTGKQLTDVPVFGRKWHEFDWRGKAPPTPEQVRDLWQQTINLMEKNGHGTTQPDHRAHHGKYAAQPSEVDNSSPEYGEWLDANSPDRLAGVPGDASGP